MFVYSRNITSWSFVEQVLITDLSRVARFIVNTLEFRLYDVSPRGSTYTTIGELGPIIPSIV